MAKETRRRPSTVAPVLVEPDEQADHHRQTRLARQTEIAEDYVELIADLIDSTGEARSADSLAPAGRDPCQRNQDGRQVAGRADWLPPSPIARFFLTDEGRRIAEESRRRHQIVVAFLQAIGVSEDVAPRRCRGNRAPCQRGDPRRVRTRGNRAGAEQLTGSLIGKPVKRLEDPALLRGAGRFVDDIHLPGMLHAAFVRSPLAHAEIGGIDTAAAQAAPGVGGRC